MSTVSGKMRDVAPTLLLLHGFAGTGRSWDPLLATLGGERYRPVAPDLRGHGARAADRPISFEAVVADLLDAAPDRFVLCGYSMGGRVALHVALAAPQRVERLVLVAATAGIEDDAERAARREADEELARFTEGATIEDFADRWTAQPLFEGTPKAIRAEWREDILRNDPVALAAALRGLGTGAMTPLWERLGELTMPATVVVGEDDPKFQTLGARLVDALPDAAPLVLATGAGHGVPRENPAAIAAVLR